MVDNLLSAERENLPDDPSVRFVEASINDDEVLASLPEDLDYVFHLSTYHGNQSSMANPLADHEHNTLTSLKLFEALKDHERLQRVVYASAGCTVAEKTFEGAEATQEDAPVSSAARQPLPDLEDHRRVLRQLLPLPVRPPGDQGALPERLRPRRGAGRGAVARHGQHGVAQRDPDVHLQGAQARGAAGGERRYREPRPDLRGGHGGGADRLRHARPGGRGLQPGERSGDHHPRARRADQRAGREPHADRTDAGARLGPLGAALRIGREGPS